MNRLGRSSYDPKGVTTSAASRNSREPMRAYPQRVHMPRSHDTGRSCRLRAVVPLVLVFELVAAVLIAETPRPSPQGSAGEGRAAQAGVLCLLAREPDSGRPGSESGILLRECVRQALLVCAREEFGLSTRDDALREPMPKRAPGKPGPLDIVTHAVPRDRSMGIKIGSDLSGDAKPLWSRGIPVPCNDDISYLVNLVEAMEGLSRNDFAALLKELGFSAKPNSWEPGATVPDEIEQRLEIMTFAEQFAAIRELHGLIRASGESPGRLGALVRGYGNLSALTHFYWYACYKVFMARALLYAQRMVARDPSSPGALWHQCYARALAGLHKPALDCLEKVRGGAGPGAEGNDGAPPALPPEPDWVPLVESYCRYEVGKLAAMESEHVELLRFLHYLTVERDYGTSNKLPVFRALKKQNEECFRVYEGFWMQGYREAKRTGYINPHTVLSRTLWARLLRMPGVPETIASLARAGLAEPECKNRHPLICKVFQTTIEEGKPGRDPGEPSWAVLGAMLQELTFLHAQRRVQYRHEHDRKDLVNALNWAKPFVADHPYADFLKTYRLDPKEDLWEYTQVVESLPLKDWDLNMLPLIATTRRVTLMAPRYGKHPYTLAILHQDLLAHKMEGTIRVTWSYDPRVAWGSAQMLERVSPYAPLSYAVYVDRDWQHAKEHAKEWEEKFGHGMELMRALAKRYLAEKRYADARRVLDTAETSTSDRWVTQLRSELPKTETPSHVKSLSDTLKGLRKK